MKYKIFIIMLLLIPMQVLASEDIIINCKKNNDAYECKVSANIDYEVSAIDFHFSLPDYANVVSYELDSRWEGSADENWVSIYSAENHKVEIPLLSLNIESKSSFKDTNIEIHDLLIYDSDYQDHKVDTKKNEKKKKNDIKKLLIVTICAIIILGIIALIIKLKGDSK